MSLLPLRRVRVCRVMPVLLVLVLLMPAVTARAGGPDFQARIGNSVVVLTGPWKFHPGDDMRWARPELDDSLWGTMDVTPPEGSYDPITGSSGFTPGWTSRGYPKLIGYAWYRMRVNVQNDTNPGESPTLALTMPLNFDDAYQVYADGRLIGQFGDFNEKGVVFYNSQPRGFELPKDVHSGPVVIAIRFWMDPSTPLTNPDVGGLHGPPMLGQASSIDAMLRLEWDAVNRTQVGNLLTITMMVLATVLGLVLFWLDRSDPAYFWLAMASLANMLTRVIVLIGYYTMILPMGTESFMSDVLFQALGLGLWALFWGYWFRLSRFRRTARLVIGLVCLSSACMALLRPPLFGTVIPVTASAWLLPISLAIKLALGVVVLWIAYQGIRTSRGEGLLALPPVLLLICWQYQEELTIIHVPTILRVFGTTTSIGPAAMFLMLTIVSVLMMRRFIRSQREREQWRMEIEQARQVQQVLIPEDLPSVQGFALASEYRPAQQVGGDFFQILPLKNGGVLVAIGDVSGKGMPAAMTVSLLVGTLRTLSEFTTSPEEILAGMNVRMLSRTGGGFTTCLVLRVEPNGRVFVANAGHLAPYLDGKELEMENGLPLGLTADTHYPEKEFRLAVGAQLTLLTDGVAEARSVTGELLGFAKTAAMTTKSAEAIAQAAQDFGQEDDITVLTVKRLGMGEEPAIRVATSVLAADLG
jgi:Stage II sporulation protein E (SpoIIE)